MDVLEAVRHRRTIHTFEPSDIAESVLHQALETALWAPNHKLTYPWKFVVVGPETRRALIELNKTLDRKKAEQPISPEEQAAQDRKIQGKMGNVASLVVFCCAKSDDSFQQREDYATVCCGIQNFMLALTAQGFGSKWGTGKLSRHPDTYDMLGINTATHDIVGFVWVGQPAQSHLPPKRPHLSDVLLTLP